MTIAQYLPQWLRSRLQKPELPKPTTASKNDRQVLPTLPSAKRPPISLEEPRSPGHQLRGLT
jgi:hypothetical protein